MTFVGSCSWWYRARSWRFLLHILCSSESYESRMLGRARIKSEKPKEAKTTTHKKPINPTSSTTNATPPPMNAYSLSLKNCSTFEIPVGDGFTNANFLPMINDPLGGVAGSKQYLEKQLTQKSEREGAGESLYRDRSIAAHCRQAPQSGSGAVDLERNPETTFVCTWSMKRRVCKGV